MKSLRLDADSSHEPTKVEIRILLDERDFANVIFASTREANENVILSQLLFIGEIRLWRHSFDVIQVQLIAIFVDIIGPKNLDTAFGNLVIFCEHNAACQLAHLSKRN